MLAKLNIKYILFTCGLVVLLRAIDGHCDVHVRGEDFFLYSNIFNKVLYSENSSVPTNYTLIFQFDSPGYGRNIEHYVFNITAKSTAKIELVDEEDSTISRTVKAIFYIHNALDLTVRALLKGHTRATSVYFPFRIINPNQKQYQPKSFTLVYVHNSTASRNRVVNIGERQKVDGLLFRTTKVVTTANRISSTDFLYENNTQSITCVEFAFDSPSANAFVNGSFIGEHKVNVIVYDLNKDQFKATMSVFGYDTAIKPISYQSAVWLETVS